MFRTMPLAAGSPPAVKTIGMVCVCCCITLVAAYRLYLPIELAARNKVFGFFRCFQDDLDYNPFDQLRLCTTPSASRCLRSAERYRRFNAARPLSLLVISAVNAMISVLLLVDRRHRPRCPLSVYRSVTVKSP